MLGSRVRGSTAVLLAALVVVFGLPATAVAPPAADAEESPPEEPDEPDGAEGGSYGDEVGVDGPLSWFRLDGADGGAVVDATGFDLTVQAAEGATVESGGLVEGSSESLLGGAAGGLSSGGLGLPAGGTARTLEVWAELPCVPFAGCAGDEASGFYGAGGDGWPVVSYGDGFGLFMLPDGQLQVRWGSDPAARAVVASEPLDYPAPGEVEPVVSHFVVVFDGSVLSVFRDGQALFSQTAVVDTVIPGGGLSAGLPFARVDEVAVYDVALSPQRVRAHWAWGVSDTATVCGPAVMSDPYGAAVAAGTPVGFWRFDEPGRVAVDSSGSCHDAARGGAVTSPSGPVGPGVGSGGSRFAFLVGGLPSGGARTVETWYRGVDPAALVFMGGDQLGLMTAGEDQLVVLNQTVGEMVPVGLPGPVTDGQWHLVALGWDPATGAGVVHFDGIQVWSGTLSAPIPPPGAPSGFALFSGEFDETAVYPSVQSEADSAARFTTGAVAPIPTGVCEQVTSDRYSDTVLGDGPLRYYRLGERGPDPGAQVALDAADVDGCQNALLGGGAVRTPGALTDSDDTGLAQNGGLVAAGEGVALQPGSDRAVEMWVRPDANGTYGGGSQGPLLDIGDGTGFATAGSAPGRLRFRFGPNQADFVEFAVSPSPVAVGEPTRQWDHVVASITAGVLTVVVNGRVVSQGPVTLTATSAGLLRVGLQSENPSGVPTGVSVDEVAVYDRGLSLDAARRHWVSALSEQAEVCPGPPDSGHAQGVIADGPVAFYRLGELAGDPDGRVAFDVMSCAHGSYGSATGKSAPVAADGALAGDPDGAAGRAFDLGDPDGDQPLLNVPLHGLPVGDEPRSIEFWGRIPDDASALAVGYGQRFMAVFGADGNPIPDAPGPPTVALVDPGSWHHFAITIDGENYHEYRDGTLVSQGGWPQGDTTASDQFLTVISGAVDELAVFDRVLTAQEITDRVTDAARADTTTTLDAPAGSWSTTEPTVFEVQVDTAGPALSGGTVRLFDELVEIATGELDGTGYTTLPVTIGEGAHHITALYDGDTSHVASRSATIAQQHTAGRAETTVAIEVSHEVSTYGEQVTATAALTSDTPGSGAVELVIDGAVRETIDATTGTPVTFTLPQLDAGQHEITARFAGTQTHGPATSPPVSWRVFKATPQFVDTPPATQRLADQHIGAGVRRAGAGANPSGWVELWVDGQHVRSNMLWSFGMLGDTSWLSFGLDEALPVGGHQLRFVYSGDTRYESVEWTGNYQVLPDAIEIDVVSSDVQADFGAPVTFTATVHAGASPVTEGSVTFVDNWADAHTVAVDAQGHATWTVGDLTSGSHEIRARYDGGQLSEPVEVQVGRLVDITVDETSVEWAAQLTGTVTSAVEGDTTIPTGWISFSQPDGTWVGTTEINPDGSYAMWISGETAVGTVDLELFYYPYHDDPAPVFAYTRIDGPTIEVVPESAEIEVGTYTASPSQPGAEVNAYALVQSAGFYKRPGVGMVSFYIDEANDPVFTGVLNHAGWIGFDGLSLPDGPHTLRAVYGGSETMAAIEGETQHRVLYRTTTGIEVHPGAATALGEPVTYTATVTTSDTTVPSGTVQFAIDGTPVGETVPLDATGSASIDVDPAGWPGGPQRAGEHDITASYTPDDTGVFIASAGESTHHVLIGSCPATPIDGHAQRILADGPVAYYRLDDLAGQPDTRVAYDIIACAHGIYGQPNATTQTVSVPGALAGSDNTAVSRGFNFDLANDTPTVMVPLDELPAGNDIRTIEFWAKAPDGTALLVGYGPRLLVFADRSGRTPDDEPDEITGTRLGDLNTWRHFAYVIDGSTITLYLDGATVGTDTWDTDWPDDSGGYLSVTGGAVDELAIYDTVLTAETIAAHHSEAAKADTTTQLVAPADGWDDQQPVEFEVTVTGGDGANPPTGQVTLYDGDTQITTAQDLDSNGHITFGVPLDAGTHRIQARYAGSGTHVASRSETINRIVDGPTASTLEVTLDETTSTYGHPVTATITADSTEAFTAEVDIAVDGVPRRSVEISDTTPATVELPAVVPGDHIVTAHLAASETHAAATSDPVEWTITKAAPVIAVTSPLTMPHDDQKLEGSVQRPGGGSNPTGHIELRSNGETVASQTLWPFWMFGDTTRFTFGTAEGPTPTAFEPLPVGTHDVEVVYTGDARYEQAQWTGTLEITPGRPGVDITIDQTTVKSGARITGVVTAADPAITETPGGSLDAYTSDGTYLGYGSTNYDGTFDMTVDGPVPPGVYDVEIRFRPHNGSGFARTTVTGFILEITPPPPGVDITVDQTTITWGDRITGTVNSVDPNITEDADGYLDVYTADGTYLGSGYTNTDGTFELTIYGEVPAGIYDIEIRFSPNNTDQFARTTVSGFTLAITPASTEVGAYVHDWSITPELTTTATAAVRTTGENPQYVSAELTVYLDDNPEPFAVIDTDVSSSIEGLPAGNHELRVVFDGTSFATGSETTISYQVQVGTRTTLTADHERVSLVSDPLTVTAHVEAPYVEGVTPTGSVQFSADSPSGPHLGEPVPIDNTGIAELTFAPDTLDPPLEGYHYLYATFTPDTEVFDTSSEWTGHHFLIGPVTPSVWISAPYDSLVGETVSVNASFYPNWVTGGATLSINSHDYTTDIDSYGSASWPLTGLPIGVHQLEISHPGSQVSNPVTVTRTIRVRGTTSVTVTDIAPVTYGERLAVSGTVTAEDPDLGLQPDGWISNMEIRSDGTFSGELLRRVNDSSVSLNYGGDDNFAPTSVDVPVQVTKATPSIELDETQIMAGEPLSGQIRLGNSEPLPLSASGTVNGNWGSTAGVHSPFPYHGDPATRHGHFQLDTTGLALGTHDITITYNGDNDLHAKTLTATIEVVPVAPTLYVWGGPQVVWPSPSQLNARVEHDISQMPVDGQIEWTIDGTVAHIQPINGPGLVSWTPSLLGGDHTVTVTYTPTDDRVHAVEHTTITRVRYPVDAVLDAPSELTVAANELIVFTGTVRSGTDVVSGQPSGHVCPGAGPYGPCAQVEADGTFSVSVQPDVLGQVEPVLFYVGDEQFAQTFFDVPVFTVEAVTPELTVTPSAVAGHPLRTKLQVQVDHRGGIDTPTGTIQVRFDDPNGPIATSGSVYAWSDGSTTVTLDSPDPGVRDIYVTYVPWSWKWTTTEAQLQWGFNAPTYVTVGTEPADPVAGQPFTVVARVHPDDPAWGVPDGELELTRGGTAWGAEPLVGDGTVRFDIDPVTTKGAASFTATYTPTDGWAASNRTETIGIAPGGVNVDLQLDATGPVPYGAPIEATITLTPDPAGACGTPAGWVTIRDTHNGEHADTLGYVDGTGSVTLTAGEPGEHTYSAQYGGSTCYDTADDAGVVPVDVSRAETVIDAVTTPNPSDVTDQVTVEVDVSAMPPGGGIPEGDIVVTVDGETVTSTPVELDDGHVSVGLSLAEPGDHTISVDYAGSDNHSGSHLEITHTVKPATTTDLVIEPGDTGAVGSAVTLRASVAEPGGAVVDDGAVRFTADGADIGEVGVTGGVAELSFVPAVTGPVELQAVYSSDVHSRSSDTATYTVTTAPTTVNLSVNNTVDRFESDVIPRFDELTVTATVERSDGAEGTVSGQVEFYDGDTWLGEIELEGGSAVWRVSTLAVGVHAIRAVYSGDDSYNTSSDDIGVEVVGARTTTVLAVPESVPSATAATLRATVNLPATGEPATAGTVVFRSGGTELGTATVNGSGVATLTRVLPLGEHHISASFAATASLAGSSSAAHVVLVRRPVQVTLGSPAGSYPHGQAVPVNVSVTSGGEPVTSGGTVSVRSGETVVAGPVPVSAVGNLIVGGLGVGVHRLAADYSGDGSYEPGSSPVAEITVRAAAPTVTLTADASQITYGDPMTFTAVVSDGDQPVNGFVTLYATGPDGEEAVGTAAVTDGMGTLTTRRVPGDTETVRARFGAIPTVASGVSNHVEVSVSPAQPEVVLTTNSPVRDGDPLRVTATVHGVTGAAQPLGDLSLEDTWNGTPLWPGWSRLVDRSSHTWTCPQPAQPDGSRCEVSGVGTHNLSVSFTGDRNYTAANSESTEAVINATAETTLTASLDDSTQYEGRPVVVNVSAGTDISAVTPSGRVRLVDQDTGQRLVTGSLDADGVAELRTSALSARAVPYQLVVTYTGDATATPASSEPLSVQVQRLNTITVITETPVVAAGATSDAITVELRDPDGNPLPAPVGGSHVELTGVSPSATIYPETGSGPIEEFTIPEGETTASFRVSDVTAGTHDLTVMPTPEVGAAPVTVTYEVAAGELSDIELAPGSQTVAPGTSSQPWRVFGADEYGNALGDVTETAALTIDGTETSCDDTTRTCTVTDRGTYEVTATAGWLTTTAVLIGNNAPQPRVVAASPDPTDGRSMTFTLAATDPDADDTLSYQIDWGDGTAPASGDVPAGEFTVTHAYDGRAATMVFSVEDGHGGTAPYATATVAPTDTSPLVAVGGDDRTVRLGDPVNFDATNSTPANPNLSYLWNFGDGTSTNNPTPSHTYAARGTYDVTLTVGDDTGTATSQLVVEVLPAEDTGVQIDVTSGASPLAGATIVLHDSEQRQHDATERPGAPGTYDLAGLADGTYTAFAYKAGHQPATVELDVADGTGAATLDLPAGEAVQTRVTTRRLSVTEAIARGVDVTAAENNHTYQFELRLHFPKDPKPRTVRGLTNGGGGGLIGLECPEGEGVEDDFGFTTCVELDLRMKAEGSLLSYIVLPGRSSWLKEMFLVHFEVVNLANPAFELAPGTATLNLPHGLSLAAMTFGAQQRTQGVEAVPGGETRTAEWVVRGDLEGLYDVSVDYTSVMNPVGEPIQIRAQSDPNEKLRVWGGSALELDFEVDDAVVANSPYRVNMALTNVSDVPVYNATLAMDPLHEDPQRWYLYQPDQQMSTSVGTLAPGATVDSPDYLLLASRSAELDLAGSSVAHVAGTEITATEITTRPAPEPAPEPFFDGSVFQGAHEFRLDGATLTWDAVEGAVGYDLYRAGSYAGEFEAEPFVSVDADTTSALLPSIEGGHGLVAVSTRLPGDGAVHREVRHQLINSGNSLDAAPDPDGMRAIDPCVGFGTSGMKRTPGNFVHQMTDAQVSSVGPDLVMRRTYNSMMGYDLGMGRGWTANWAMRGVMDDHGNTGLLLPDGRCIPSVVDEGTRTARVEVSGEVWTAAMVDDPSDPTGSRTVVSDVRNKVTYHLTGSGQLAAIEDPTGNRTEVTYAEPTNPDDIWGGLRPDYVTDVASGRQLDFEWDPDGRLVSVSTDPVTTTAGTEALTWRYYYDGDYLVAVCDPRDNRPPDDGGSCTRYDYETGDDNQQRVSGIRRPKGNTALEVSYDNDARLATVAQVAGQTTSYSYDDEPVDGVAVRVQRTDPRGSVTVTDFDRENRILASSSGLQSVQFGFDVNGFLDSTRDSSGEGVDVEFDDNGNLRSLTDTAASTTTWFGTLNDDLTSITDPRAESPGAAAYTTTFTWDQHHRPITATTPPTDSAPQGATTSWTYSGQELNGQGRWVGTTDAEGGGKMPPGLQLSETRPVPDGYAPDANRTVHSYDRHGNRVRSVSPTGVVTTATFDELGRRTTETVHDPAGGTTAMTEWAYDELGDVTSVTQPVVTNGVSGFTHQLQVTTSYDDNANIERVEYIDVGTGDTPARVIETVYDDADRPVEQRQRLDGDSWAVTKRTYDRAGNVATVTDPEGRVTRTEYDTANRPTEIWRVDVTDPADPDGPVRDVRVAKIEYDPLTGVKTATVDAAGRRTEYDYDPSGRLQRSTLVDVTDPDNGDSFDHVISEVVEFDDAGNPTVEEHANGTVRIERTFDALNREQTSTFDPDGLERVTTNGWDRAGNQTLWQRSGPMPDGSVRTETTTATWDHAHRQLSATVLNDTAPLITGYTHDAFGRVLTETDPNQATWTATYDLLGRVVSTSAPEVPVDGNPQITVTPTQRYGYDVFGSRTQVEDPNGGVWVSEYDRAGRLTSEVAPDYTRPADGATITGAATSYGYDLVGNVTEVEDPAGNQTSYVYDDFDRVVTRTDPKLASENTAGVWGYRYDDVGRLTQQTDPLGAKVLATYDELDNQVSVSEVVRRDDTDAVTHTTRFGHDPAGNVTAVIDPSGARQVATYDPAGQMVTYLDAAQTATADPKAVTFTYDPAGRVVGKVDQLGRRTRQTFDLAGRQTSHARFDGDQDRWLMTSYGYDPAGRLTVETSPRGQLEGFSTTYGYDPAGRLSTVIEPVDEVTSSVTSYGYDPAGNLTRLVDGNGNITTYAHSSWGLPEATVEPATATAPTVSERSYTTSYDSRGLPEVEQLPDQVTITREFDELANLTRETADSGDPDIPGVSRNLRFNALGDLVETSHPDGQVGYVYDDRGLLVEQTDPDGTTTGFAYDPVGRLTERTDPESTTRFGWDPRGLVDTVTDPVTGTKLTVGYDDAGQQVTQSLPGYGTRSVVYDDLARPVTDTLVDSTGTTTYAQSTGYDDNNNPTSHTYGGTAVPGEHTGTNTYSYDRADRLTGHTTPDGTLTGYGWDLAGNRTQAGEVTYSYNQRNQLTSTSAGDTYSWSDRGTRDTHTVDGVTVTDTYDALGQLVDHNARVAYRYDALGRITDRTVDNQPTEVLGYDRFGIDPVTVGDTRITRDPHNIPITTVTGDDAPGWVSINAHTDLAAVTTTDSTTVSLYGPFGNPTTPTTGGPLGFQGDLTDPASGNVWMGARHHDPSTGGFTTRDTYPGTTSQPNTLNRYGYGAGNPLRYHDPDGHAVFDPWTGGFDPARFVIDQDEDQGGIRLLACSEADIPDELRKYNPATFGENLTPACQDVQLKYSLVNNGKLSVDDACAAMPDADVTLCYAFFIHVSHASLRDALKLSLKIIGYYSQFLQTIILIGLAAIAPAAAAVVDTSLSCTQAIEHNESNWADQAGCAAGVAAGFTTAIKGAKQTGLAFDDYLATQQTQRTSTSGTQNYTNWGDELTNGARMVDQPFAPSSSRGLSNLGGVIEETGTNAAGGRIFTSTGSINQNDFAGIVNAGVTRGDDVHIFTGAHGFADGTIRADAGLRAADVARFGDIPGVQIHDFASMTPARIRQILNGPGTIIGGFCDSGACLAPYRGG